MGGKSEPVVPEASTMQSIERNVEWVKNNFSDKLGVELKRKRTMRDSIEKSAHITESLTSQQ